MEKQAQTWHEIGTEKSGIDTVLRLPRIRRHAILNTLQGISKNEYATGTAFSQGGFVSNRQQGARIYCRRLFFLDMPCRQTIREVIALKEPVRHPQPPPTPSLSRSKWRKRLSVTVLVLCMTILFCLPASAAPATPTIWDQAKIIMQDIYNKILGISTIAGIVAASIALLLMNFSKNDRTVGESRAWLKRIIVSWAILNGLGFIMSYITPFFVGGQWTP